jgi:tetratricopeptide (TPR) repeat protein
MQEQKGMRIIDMGSINNRRNAAALLLAVILVPWLGGCQKRLDTPAMERLVQMSEPMYKGEPVSPEAIRQVRKALADYQQAIDEQVDRKEELGILYRDLALRYLDINIIQSRIAEIRLASEQGGFVPGVAASGDVSTRSGGPSIGMPVRGDALYYEALALGFLEKDIFQDALENLKKAITIFPKNKLLYYYAGVSAANLGKSMVSAGDAAEREQWYRDAEGYYLQALELDAVYDEALYGLSVLYVYELGRPLEAQVLLERLLELQPKNIEARFLMAAAYYAASRYDQAIEQYEIIEKSGTTRDNRRQAGRNKEQIVEEIYELRGGE